VVVVVLLKAPQAPAVLLPQATVQVTPAFFESLVTVAVSEAVPLIWSDAGWPESATVMLDGDVMVMAAEADLVLSATEVAVTVTLAPVGIAAGAVYVAEVVVALLMAPQAPAPELPQLTDQVTPALLESLLTVAVRAAVVLI
jgi:hypothetical protein